MLTHLLWHRCLSWMRISGPASAFITVFLIPAGLPGPGWSCLLQAPCLLHPYSHPFSGPSNYFFGFFLYAPYESSFLAPGGWKNSTKIVPPGRDMDSMNTVCLRLLQFVFRSSSVVISTGWAWHSSRQCRMAWRKEFKSCRSGRLMCSSNVSKGKKVGVPSSQPFLTQFCLKRQQHQRPGRSLMQKIPEHLQYAPLSRTSSGFNTSAGGQAHLRYVRPEVSWGHKPG